ncbi:protein DETOXIFICATION 27-like isoform X2 [Corylus avellana]|uniref:protein DETOXIFICATION 27-like isoform X2 n=1 Tax=Corylus avellana TaxID=13451 RepID=UPI00286CAB4A|nr:protein DETOXIFICATION 27-like isoform X2 [Corylus avellana]
MPQISSTSVIEESKLPLLDHHLCSTIHSNNKNDGHELRDYFSQRFWIESKKLWHIVGPAIFFRATNYSMIVITQIFAGHLGDLELAAISLAYNVIIGFDFGLLLGLASALETLCGQAFGAKKYYMLGVYLQRAWIILFICCVLILPLFLFTSPILRLMGQPREVAELTGVVAVGIIPLHFCLGFLFPLQRFLQCQLKTGVIAWLSLIVLLMHLITSWLFVYVFKLGVIGTAVTLSFSWWLLALGLLLYTLFGGCPLTWNGFSIDAFSGLWEFTKLSAASGVMICLENWYYRILILITGSLSNAEIDLDALSICMAISSWQMMIPLSFFAGAGVRVANELGAGNGEGARFATVVSVVTSTMIGLGCWFVIMILNHKIALLFSSSEPVLEMVDNLKVLLAFTILLNSIQPVLSGVAVGSGWQAYVAYINLGCYYLLGLPLGYLLGWHFHQGVMGIWAGMMFGGVGIQTLILAMIVGRCNWDKEDTWM